MLDAASPTPGTLLQSNYNAISRRDYALAYGLLAPQGRPAFARFVAGYAKTGVVRITRLVAARYL